jgi:hypothetical protein
MFRARPWIAILAVLAASACSSSKKTATSSPSSTTTYRPAIDATQFSATIDNPWFPLPVGRTLEYTGSRDGEQARELVTITAQTRTIAGVPTRVVRDVLYLDGVLAERTRDYYSQDAAGNVWYFGEDTAELNDKGVVTSTEGTWHSGVDGAQPGIIMEATPTVGKTMRQEYLKGHAEDFFKVVDLAASTTVPAGTYSPALRTEEWTPLEPDVLSNKYYARGIGIVREADVKGGNEKLELQKVS